MLLQRNKSISKCHIQHSNLLGKVVLYVRKCFQWHHYSPATVFVFLLLSQSEAVFHFVMEKKVPSKSAPDFLHRHPIWCLLYNLMVSFSLNSNVWECTDWKLVADNENYKSLLVVTACYMVSDLQ